MNPYRVRTEMQPSARRHVIRYRPERWRWRGLAVACTGLLAASAAAEPTLLVLSGAQAPGLPPGVLLAFPADVRINSEGDIIFWSELSGPGVTPANAGSVWRLSAGTPSLIYRQGDPSPIAGHHFGAIPWVALSESGSLALTGALVDTSTPNHPLTLGLFAQQAAGLATLAVEGQPAIGAPMNWSGLPLLRLGAAHAGVPQGAFSAVGGGGIWAFNAGEVTRRHLAGDPAPGTTRVFAFLAQPATGPRGETLFHSTLADTAGGPPVSSGLFFSNENALTAVALVGEQAPGLPAGTTFAELSSQPQGTLGRHAFWARTAGPGTTAQKTGIWYRDGGELQPLALSRQPAPGLHPDVLFESFSRQVAMTASGTIAFSAQLGGRTAQPHGNSSIWVRQPGGPLMLVAREGDQAPRLPAGTFFHAFGPVVMNDHGQIAFTAYLRGPAVTLTDNFVLYATDRRGELMVIVRRGDQLDVSGTPRTVAEITFDSAAPGSGHTQFATVGGRDTLVYKLRLLTGPPTILQGLYSSHVRCLADIDGSGSLNVEDFAAFINAYAAGDLRRVDIDGNGMLNVEDFAAFINAYAAGCAS
jgi:hypothetical protein